MYSITKLIRTISLMGACVFAITTIRAVDPPPDGGYPNQNTAEGESSLFSLTTGFGNTAVGFQALFSVTTGTSNTATGAGALQSDTTGGQNTAHGSYALTDDTTGSDNTANGFQALGFNTTGSENTATGEFALLNNTTGGDNTATGEQALAYNSTGNNNTANGSFALISNTTGDDNTATGFQALFLNTTGTDNTANGFNALFSNTTANNNTADGWEALFRNTTGTNNTAGGFQALFNNTTGANNTADGINALLGNTTGSSNIALGFNAGVNLTTGSNNIDIGNVGVAGESKTIRIGTKATHRATFVAGISGATVAGGVGVIIDTNGHLGTVVSSARFKDAIKPMDKASEAILALQPVTFHYKKELDPAGIPQFGLVAEQVEKVDPDLVARDAEGKSYTVRYEAVNAMLLNEFLKEHHTVQELKSTSAKQEAAIAQQQLVNAEQRKAIEALTEALKEQAAQIQKVSDQLGASRPAPRLVVDSQ